MLTIIRCLFLSCLLMLMSTHATAQAQNCDSPEYRHFDFWIGDWKVTQADGSVAGTNSIKSSYGGCVLEEHYRVNGQPYGESLNAYDRVTQKWYQTWMDKNGTVLLLSGGLKGDSMVLSGQSLDATGAIVKHQISWHPQEDGSVVQHWQLQQADSDAWTTLFKGIYTKLTH